MPWKTKTDTIIPYQEIEGKSCTITLERRPHYCDRGNFIAKLHAHGKFALEIDGADGWDRYFFNENRAKLEIEAWLKKRGQWVDDEETEDDTERAIRMVMERLVAEYPKDKILYRTANGETWTGGQMAREIEQGSEIGRHYASEILRISRELLQRQAEH